MAPRKDSLQKAILRRPSLPFHSAEPNSIYCLRPCPTKTKFYDAADENIRHMYGTKALDYIYREALMYMERVIRDGVFKKGHPSELPNKVERFDTPEKIYNYYWTLLTAFKGTFGMNFPLEADSVTPSRELLVKWYVSHTLNLPNHGTVCCTVKHNASRPGPSVKKSAKSPRGKTVRGKPINACPKILESSFNKWPGKVLLKEHFLYARLSFILGMNDIKDLTKYQCFAFHRLEDSAEDLVKVRNFISSVPVSQVEKSAEDIAKFLADYLKIKAISEQGAEFFDASTLKFKIFQNKERDFESILGKLDDTNEGILPESQMMAVKKCIKASIRKANRKRDAAHIKKKEFDRGTKRQRYRWFNQSHGSDSSVSPCPSLSSNEGCYSRAAYNLSSDEEESVSDTDVKQQLVDRKYENAEELYSHYPMLFQYIRNHEYLSKPSKQYNEWVAVLICLGSQQVQNEFFEANNRGMTVYNWPLFALLHYEENNTYQGKLPMAVRKRLEGYMASKEFQALKHQNNTYMMQEESELNVITPEAFYDLPPSDILF